MDILLVIVLLFAARIGAILADLAKFQKCEKNSNDICEVTEVRINPCKDGKFCRLTKGEDTSIEFDFIPKFDAGNLTTGLYWAALKRDVPYSEFTDVDACVHTHCPTQAGSKQQFTYSTRLSDKLRSGRFTFKWKLWNSDDKTKMCCFKTEVAF